MFRALASGVPAIQDQADKRIWSEAMEKLIALRDTATVGGVVDYLLETRRPRVPDAVERRERELRTYTPQPDTPVPRELQELAALRKVSYREIVSLSQYLSGHSPFATKHGVKGAEFENVLVVVGRGWNMYNFNDMLEMAANPDNIPSTRQDSFERNRNLFYVSCSRPKRRLAILFTQALSSVALQTVRGWFGAENVDSLFS